MKRVLIFAAAAVTVGCAGSDSVSTAECPVRPASNIIFWWETPALQRGEAVTLTPYYTERPGMMEPLPPSCVTGASLGPQGAAFLGRDAQGALVMRIAEDAAPGQVRFTARYGEGGDVSGRIDIYDPAASPLTGRWRQDSEACAVQGAEPIRELIFEGDGEFSVTWTPFEVYKDYWGRYAFDPATSELTLEPESGNHIPADVRSGEASLSKDGDTLVLKTASFGTPRSSRRCDAPFVRGR